MKQKTLLFSTLLLALSCSDSGDGNAPQDEVTDVPAVYQRFTDNVTLYVEGEFLVIETDDIPNHPSPYFSQTDSRYEAYNGGNSNFHRNPNTIAEQNITLRIPLNPTPATQNEATPLGAIGISLNGVVFFNQYAGPNNQPLTNEIDSFDQYLGHPANSGNYHYHQEPLYLTTNNGSDALLGWLLDGYPVYGPVENGNRVNNGQLDEFHGHSHATTDYPEGIYHYHITDADPYINGSGFYGVAGTVTN
ncbi:MAG: YHYH protein [Bacteroidota bacterium]|nr:YHYH protein [Bacteroidota bacterium]